MPLNDLVDDVVAHDLDQLVKDKRFESRPFGKLKHEYFVNGNR